MKPERKWWWLRLAVFISLLLTAPPVLAAEQQSGVWQVLHSGVHFALLRHAIAPGFGDPPEFSLDDCQTQRNLSAAGRDQATRIGASFRKHGIRTARVFSSQWCRCLETANLLKLGPVEVLPALNSFFSLRERQEAQMQSLRQWLAGQSFAPPLILVTHQVNITALSGVYPESGELVIMRRAEDGEMSVVGTINTD